MTPTENPASTSPTGDRRTAGRDRTRRTAQSSRTETHSRFGADRRQTLPWDYFTFARHSTGIGSDDPVAEAQARNVRCWRHRNSRPEINAICLMVADV